MFENLLFWEFGFSRFSFKKFLNTYIIRFSATAKYWKCVRTKTFHSIACVGCSKCLSRFIFICLKMPQTEGENEKLSFLLLIHGKVIRFENRRVEIEKRGENCQATSLRQHKFVLGFPPNVATERCSLRYSKKYQTYSMIIGKRFFHT